MGKKQTGIIYTNDNCIGCNKCIITCPIPGANRSVIEKGRIRRILVDGTKCIHCGECLKSCQHNAREYIDDTEQFLRDIERENITAVIAPSFYLIYRERAGQIINYLLAKGVRAVYDVSIGADIAVWAYLKKLDEHPEGGFVLQSCPAIVNYAEQYSYDLFSHLMPVHSPAVCTAIYLHKYLKITDKIAFIGPCIAKKDEFNLPETNGEITYNVTFGHLMDELAEEDLSGFSKEIPNRGTGLGTMFPLRGGAKANLRNYLDRDEFVLAMDSMVYQLPYMEHYEQVFFKREKSPDLIDLVSCEYGCFMSAGTQRGSVEYIDVANDQVKLSYDAAKANPELYSKVIPGDEKKKLLYERYAELDINDFTRKHVGRFIYKRSIPNDVVNEIFDSMLKTEDPERHIDCSSCGYKSCREMVEAIALGYNRKENCVHYEQAENRRLYVTDVVTGIPSVSTFNSRLNDIIHEGLSGEYATVAFSLLEWELVNERFSYSEGDKGLNEFAAKAAGMAAGRELVTRLGGVDFMAIIEKQHVNEFTACLEAIKIHPSNGIREIEYSVSLAIGIYMMQEQEGVAGDIISRTNIAVGTAKSGGNRIVYYSQSMRTKLLESMEIVKAFPEAIRRHEFVVFYQPKIDIKTNELNGAEALIRWRTQDGMVSPGKFIPLFEKNGLVCQLDYYVLRMVCRDIRRWIDEGNRPVCISSNFSKLHFNNTDVVDQIIRIVDEYQVPHELIEIEVTETAYEDCKGVLTDVLKQLKENGFSTAIDDFGSGYSSLNILSNLDFQVLKLDKAFLDSGIDNAKVRSVVESVITMAKKLDMRVVAEGVEKREELDLLGELSCDLIQGFYFDRPMPVKDFEKRLRIPDYYA